MFYFLKLCLSVNSLTKLICFWVIVFIYRVHCEIHDSVDNYRYGESTTTRRESTSQVLMPPTTTAVPYYEATKARADSTTSTTARTTTRATTVGTTSRTTSRTTTRATTPRQMAPSPPPVDDCPGLSLKTWTDDCGFPVNWPASNFSDSLIVSTPLCLDHHKQLQVKTCERYSGWQPEVVQCTHTQDSYDLAEKCPDGYESVTNEICVLIHPRRPFTTICDESLVPFSMFNMTQPELVSFFTHLRNHAYGQMYWLPAKQMNVNGSLLIGTTYTIDELGLQWTMPAYSGERLVINDNCPTCNFTVHGGCLAFHPMLNRDNRFNSSLINCDTNLNSFCLFKNSYSLHQLACPDGYVAPMMPKELNIQCLSISRFNPISVGNVSNSLINEYCQRNDAYQMNSVEATFNFELLANQSSLSSDERCVFGANSRQVTINQETFINLLGRNNFGYFVNWDITMGLHNFNFSTDYILSTDYLGKWFWESNEISCIVCSVTVHFLMPRLELRYDSGTNKLTLTLTNSNFLITRFTNNLKFMCFASVHNQYAPNLQATQLTNDVELSYDINLIGPGIYWCSGHVIYHGTLIESNKVYAQGIVMKMWVEYDCRPNCRDFDSLFNSFLYRSQVNQTFIIDPAHIRIEEVSNSEVHYPIGARFVNILFQVTIKIVNEEALRAEPNNLNLSDEMLTYYFVQQKFILISNIQNERTTFRIRSVNSTNFCLPSSISILSEINWLGARINETIQSVEGCINFNGRPLLRMCVGDTYYGARWLRLSSESHCDREETSDLTEHLQDLVNNFEDPEQSKEVIESLAHLITNSSDRLVRMDIFFVSQIMNRVTAFLNNRTLSNGELRNLVVIYNNIMQVNHEVARSSATFNSTNVLLESLELVLIHEAAALINASEIIPVNNTSELSPQTSVDTMISSYNDGIVRNISPMLINFVIDPMLTDVSGVAILNKDKRGIFGGNINGLYDYTIQYLYKNESMTEVLLLPDLEVASYLPNNVLVHILAKHPDAKLVFSIFYNDVLFQTVKNTTYVKSDGKIIAVTVPGLDELPGMIPIYVKPEQNLNDYCGYWDYNNVDGWSETGCLFLAQAPETMVVMCGCNHLTHFAYLLKGNSSQLEEIHRRSLQGITVLGCTLSLIGIMGIYVTAIQFRSWRSKASTKYLLQLSTAIAFQMILLAFVNTAPMTLFLLVTNNETWCIVIGVLLHYFVLAMFFWMLIIAYLQFIRYVIVFNHVKTSRFLLKSSFLGWTLPMIPVLLVVTINSETYIPDLVYSHSQICYPSGYALYFGILLPIGVIVGANLVIFILVNYNLLRGTNAVCRAGDRNSKLSQLRLSIFLFFLLGLTWIFGLLSTAFSETSIVFSYLFCLTSTLQGFVMFLYFVILDPVARNLWVYFFKRMFCSKRGNIEIRKDKDSSIKDSF